MSKIYFLQVGMDGPIKIGFAKTNAEKRIRGLMSISPHTLRWIGVFDGTLLDEKQAHTLLRYSWLRGEWFHPTAEVLAFVEQKSPHFPAVVLESRAPPRIWNRPDRAASKSGAPALLKQDQRRCWSSWNCAYHAV